MREREKRGCLTGPHSWEPRHDEVKEEEHSDRPELGGGREQEHEGNAQRLCRTQGHSQDFLLGSSFPKAQPAGPSGPRELLVSAKIIS